MPEKRWLLLEGEEIDIQENLIEEAIQAHNATHRPSHRPPFALSSIRHKLRCLEETGGYTTTVYVPAESATEIARLEGAVRRLRERLLFELKYALEPYTIAQVEAAFDAAVSDPSDPQADTFTEIDAKEFKLAQEDPNVEELHRRADDHMDHLRGEGRIEGDQ